MNVENRPQLTTRYGQAKFKVKDHGAIHNLDYHITKKGGTITHKTEENIYEFMNSIENLVYDPDTTWFYDGMYQKNTDREIEVIHAYDEEKNIIVVFKRSTGEFITTCQLKPEERTELLETRNFGGGKD